MRRIWIAVGAGGALLVAVLAFALTPTASTEPTAAAEGTVAAPPARGRVVAQPLVRGGINTSPAKEAWLRERFGTDLNADGEHAADAADTEKPSVKLVNAAAPKPTPSPELSPSLSSDQAKQHFDRDTSKIVEQFPDTKAFVEEMKADIAMAQRDARLAAERANVQRANQQ